MYVTEPSLIRMVSLVEICCRNMYMDGACCRNMPYMHGINCRNICTMHFVENSCVGLCKMPGVERLHISLTSVVKTARICMVSVVETTRMSTESASEISLCARCGFRNISCMYEVCRRNSPYCSNGHSYLLIFIYFAKYRERNEQQIT